MYGMPLADANHRRVFELLFLVLRYVSSLVVGRPRTSALFLHRNYMYHPVLYTYTSYTAAKLSRREEAVGGRCRRYLLFKL